MCEPVLFQRYISIGFSLWKQSVVLYPSCRKMDAYLGSSFHFFANLKQDAQFLLTGGVEKVLRIYDLNRLDAPPREVDKTAGSVRTVTWLHSDQTILSSCTDIGGVRYG